MLSSSRGENLDTKSRFAKSQLLKLKTSQRSAICQTKNNLVTFPPFPKLSVKFQRNRLPNVQDIKLFNVRSPPKFCLINLFMSSLSPAALNTRVSSVSLRKPLNHQFCVQECSSDIEFPELTQQTGKIGLL